MKITTSMLTPWTPTFELLGELPNKVSTLAQVTLRHLTSSLTTSKEWVLANRIVVASCAVPLTLFATYLYFRSPTTPTPPTKEEVLPFDPATAMLSEETDRPEGINITVDGEMQEMRIHDDLLAECWTLIRASTSASIDNDLAERIDGVVALGGGNNEGRLLIGWLLLGAIQKLNAIVVDDESIDLEGPEVRQLTLAKSGVWVVITRIAEEFLEEGNLDGAVQIVKQLGQGAGGQDLGQKVIQRLFENERDEEAKEVAEVVGITLRVREKEEWESPSVEKLCVKVSPLGASSSQL